MSNQNTNDATEVLKNYIGGLLLDMISLNSQIASLKEQIAKLESEKNIPVKGK